MIFDDAAEGFHRVGDPLVIGGDDDCIDAIGGRSTTVDVLDHRSANDIGENFPGETRRIVTSGNDGDCVLC